MTQYMAVLRGTAAEWKRQSPEAIQRIMEKYMAWVKKLRDEERFVGGSALTENSRVLSSSGSQIVIDGPFPETKEMLTGYFLFHASNIEEAIGVAQDCPALLHGEKVEVIELAD